MLRVPTVLAALVAAGGLAACSTAPASGPVLYPHTDHVGPMGPVPPGLERFYGQELDWGPCAGYASSDDERASFQDRALECARLTVPMNYDDPQGPTATIGVLRKPATEHSERIGSLIMNPGGPGASGMNAAAGMAEQVNASGVGRRFDLVGFDPRGIGASRPQVRCLTDHEWDGARSQNDTDSSPGGIERVQRDEQQYAAKCLQRTPRELLANVGTRDVVKDVDVLRSALGEPKLNFLGYSYGTRLGMEYSRQFPNNVRSMVLDGAIDPTQSTNEQSVAQANGFQKAFESFATWCANQESCALGRDPDPRRAVSEFQRLTRPLAQHPIPVGDGRQLSYKDATTAATQALYAPSLWARLNTGLAQLSHGRGGKLMSLADSYYERSSNGHYANITDAYNAVRCADDPRVTDPNAQREANARYRAAAPFLDDGQQASSALDTCAFWPVPPSPPQPASNTGAPPALVISTTGDPATPYQAGVNLANDMRAGMLTFVSTQHTAFLQGNPCVDATATRYLTTGALPPQGARCDE